MSERAPGDEGASPRAGLGLLAILIFGVALAARVPGIGARSFWLDEAATLKAALAPDLAGVMDVVGRTETGKGPVYYVLLHWWASLFGDGEAAMRWMSALAGAATAGVAAWWAGALTHANGANDGPVGVRAGPARLAAFGVGLIVAFHPLLVTLSREARSYTLSHFFLALAAAASVPVLLDRSREPGSPARLAWVAVPAALGVSCHLFSGFFMVGLFAALLLQLRADRGRVIRVLACGVLFAVLLSAQLPLTLKQVGQHYAIAPPATVLTLRDWAHYTLEIAGGKPGGIGVGVLLVLGAAALWRDPVGRFAAVTVLASAVVLLGLHFFVKPILIGGTRYLAWLALPAAVGAAAAAASLRRFGGIALILVVAGLVVSRSRALDHEERYHEDWRAVAELLREAASPADLVLCHRAFVADPLELYYSGAIARATLVDREDRLPDLAPASAALLRGDRVFLVWSHAGELSDTVRRRLAAELGPSEEELTQHAISVLRFGEPR